MAAIGQKPAEASHTGSGFTITLLTEATLMNMLARTLVFIVLFAALATAIGGVGGITWGLLLAFIGTVFIHSYMKERRDKLTDGAGPTRMASSDAATDPAAALVPGATTGHSLQWARWTFMLMLACVFLFPESVGKEYASYRLTAMLVLFAVFHVQLGHAAASFGRSWAVFGLLPLLLPVLGGLISFGVLWQVGPRKAAADPTK